MSRSKTILEQYKAYPQLLASKRFLAYCLCMAFSVGAFYAFLAGAPLAALAFDLSPALLGLCMGSITGGFMLGSFLAGRLTGKITQITLLIAGRLLACAGLLLGIALYFAQFDHMAALFGPCLFVGISNGLTQPSANAAAISVRPAQTGTAAGLAGALTIAGASSLAAIGNAVLTKENARIGMLLVMLASATIALGAALIARRLEMDSPRARRADRCRHA